MPPDPMDPRAWLRHARSDLAAARTRVSDDQLLEHLCFHAQQAAEKALKAVLLAIGVDFPKTHDIQALLSLLPPEETAPEVVRSAPALTPYAVEFRYPGFTEPVDEDEHREALGLAEAVVAWAETLIAPPEPENARSDGAKGA
jgi:HEPN domain-containing protein